MSDPSMSRFETLVALLCQVKPSLVASELSSHDRLIDDLGLDSLDLLQLARKITRQLKDDFDLDTWGERDPVQRATVGSLLDYLDSPGAA